MVNELGISKMKCRILYLVGQLGPGGLERQLFCLLEALDRKHYLPLVVVWNFQDNDTYVKRIRELGVEVLSLSRGIGPIRKLLTFGRMVKELDPEVIHSYCFYTNFAAYWGGLLTSAVAVGALQSDFFTEKKNSGIVLGRLSARWPNTHISNNIMAAENVKKVRGIFSPQKLFVVRNGLDLKMFKNVNLPNFKRAKILAVGSLLPVKRWDRLLRAAVALKQNGHDFLIRLVGVGPLRSMLENQSQSLGLTDFVKFLGYRNDIPDLLADSHFLTHTSDREGCPNVVIETMACGRAVVATDVGDVPFLVDEGETGFVVGREDHVNLTQRMGVLIKDIELCRRMGEAGRLKAEKEFGLDRLLSENLAVYRSAGWNDT
jgi:glycosyltransferase involved in cell wall biosynthesis